MLEISKLLGSRERAILFTDRLPGSKEQRGFYSALESSDSEAFAAAPERFAISSRLQRALNLDLLL